MISELAYIDATGYHMPDYPGVLEALRAEYRIIYGEDVYLEEDSQDGQWLAVQALACYELMALGAQVYNSFSPLTAMSDALSRNVKINGIRRRTATFSTVDLLIVGQTGTVILNGVAEDILNQKWNLPDSVTIPIEGQITVTATADELGDKGAVENTITKISTPVLGWQTVNNPLSATEGLPVETDAQLRRRQTFSTALGSLSVFEGTIGAVAGVNGVVRYKGYENDSNATDSDGIPAHNISLVVEGGNTQAIADAIAQHKTPGTPTYGTTAATTYDVNGVPNTIRFYRPTTQPIKVGITIKALPGYLTGYADMIKASVVAAINSLDIGEDVLITKLYVPANLPGTKAGTTFNIVGLQIAKVANAVSPNDVVIAFNEVASAIASNVNITVVT